MSASLFSPRLIAAKKVATCWACAQPIEAGAPIYWHKGGWRAPSGQFRSPVWHQACAQPITYKPPTKAEDESEPEETPKAEQPVSVQPRPVQAPLPMAQPEQAHNGHSAPKADDPIAQLARALAPHMPQQQPQAQPIDAEAVRAIVRDALEHQEPKRVEIVVPDLPPVDVTSEHAQFKPLAQLLALGERVYLAGPAGSGKTTAAERAGKALGLETFLLPPCSDPVELLGYRDAAGNYQGTPLYNWATHEGPALLILDEIDRSAARALLAINAALANGWAVFPIGQVRIPDHHRVVATANTWGTGASADYVGSARQDAALLDRFTARLPWPYDEKLEARLAEGAGGSTHGPKAHAASLKIRSNLSQHGIRLIWGPRATIALARRLAAGMSMAQALDVSALNSLESEQRRKATEGVR